jgi:hypothetical protein
LALKFSDALLEPEADCQGLDNQHTTQNTTSHSVLKK